jgi:hypothetical protein
MAKRLGISFATVARIWRKWNIQPHRIETFKFCECRCGAPEGRTARLDVGDPV